MIRLDSRRLFGALFVLGLCAVLGNMAVSQVPTVKGKGKLKVMRQYVVSVGAGQTVQVSDPGWIDGLVPPKRQFVLTDLIISNLDANTAFGVKVARDGDFAGAPTFIVPGESTFAHAFGSGLSFPAGSKIEVRSGGTGVLTVTITGYERNK